MCRFLLACALLFSVVGCSSDLPKSSVDKPVAVPRPSLDTAEGPGIKDLPTALDLPLYPGARLLSTKIGTLAGHPNEKRYHVTLDTPDSVKRVVGFYAKNGIPGDDHLAKDQSMGTTPHGNLVIIDSQSAGGRTTIVIRVSPDGEPSK